MSYTDLFVIPVQKQHLEKYREFARVAEAVWREHGALEYHELIADDVKPGKVTSFPQSVQLKDDEIVAVGTVTYKSRAHRDEVSKKVMDDPRMKEDMSNFPVDGMRMFFGGFKPLF